MCTVLRLAMNRNKWRGDKTGFSTKYINVDKKTQQRREDKAKQSCKGRIWIWQVAEESLPSTSMVELLSPSSDCKTPVKTEEQKEQAAGTDFIRHQAVTTVLKIFHVLEVFWCKELWERLSRNVLIHSRCLATKELVDYLSDFCWGDEQPHPKRLCLFLCPQFKLTTPICTENDACRKLVSLPPEGLPVFLLRSTDSSSLWPHQTDPRIQFLPSQQFGLQFA